MDSLGRLDGMRPLIADVRKCGADRRGDLALHSSIPGINCRETVIERANKGIDTSGKSGLPLTPTHWALSGVKLPVTGSMPLGSVMRLQLLVARVPPRAVAGFRRTGPFDRKKAVLKSCLVARVFVVIDWLASTGKFCVTA